MKPLELFHVGHPNTRKTYRATVTFVSDLGADCLDQLHEAEEWERERFVLIDETIPPTWVPEPWRAASAAMRFGSNEDRRYGVSIRETPDDWWASDGHAALRCGPGPAPKGLKKTAESNLTYEGLFKWSQLRAVNNWLETTYDHQPERTVRLGAEGPTLALKYLLLVEGSIQITEWRRSGRMDPAVAFVGAAPVAAIMPINPSSPEDIAADQDRFETLISEVRCHAKEWRR